MQAPDEPTTRSVHRTSRATTLSHEAQSAMFEAGRKRWSSEGLYQPYDAFAAGEPCRACHRALRDVEGVAEEPLKLEAATDNDAFRSAHTACGFGFWRIQDCSTDHCHRCCPPPPLSPRQIDVLRELLSPASSGPLFSWYVELTCEHAEFVITGRADEPPHTARCTECDTTRGVIVAARSSNQRADDALPGAAEHAAATCPHFQPLTDEQWQRVARIVQPENPAHRGRPSADARTIVNAIRYRAHYAIPWRELPPSFGSWQTVARRYRQLVTDGRWEQIMRMLGET